MKLKWIANAILVAFLLASGAMPAMAAQTVTVTLPTFPVTLNDTELVPKYDEYPVIVYHDITYFPMTYYYGSFLGLRTDWSNNTLTISNGMAVSERLRRYEKKEANRNKYTATITTSNIVVNGKAIQNNKEPYPLLLFRDITYFPLTWRFAVDEFGWDYHFDAKQGLQIQSHATNPWTVVVGDITISYPANSFNEQYIFTYQNGNHEIQSFSLQTQLTDGIYYFNYQDDENGCPQLNSEIKPSIDGDILRLPCVRQNDITGERENLILNINFVEGKIISKEKASLLKVS